MVSYNLPEYAVQAQVPLAELNSVVPSIHQCQRFSSHSPCAFIASAEQPRKRKRTRTVYSAFQVSELEREFQHNMYVFRRHRCKVAQRLNLSEAQVKVWFQNRRMRLKRDLRDLYVQNSAVKPSKSQSNSNAHNEIVKRLMSYSKDAGSGAHNSTLDSFVGRTLQRKTDTQAPHCNAIQQSNSRPQIHGSMVASSLPTQEVIFNLDSSASYDPSDLDLLLQSIKNDLESFAQAQQLPQVAPSMLL